MLRSPASGAERAESQGLILNLELGTNYILTRAPWGLDLSIEHARKIQHQEQGAERWAGGDRAYAYKKHEMHDICNTTIQTYNNGIMRIDNNREVQLL